MSTGILIRRVSLLVCMVLTVVVSDHAPTPGPTFDAAGTNQQPLAFPGARSLSRTVGTKPAEFSTADRGKLTNTLTRLPLSFEPNRGQSAPEVRFLTRTPGYLLQLTATEMRMIVKGAPENPGHERIAQENSTDETPTDRVHALKLIWRDANRNAEVVPESSLPGTVNYFKGSDSSKWHTNIPTFERVRYTEMYPGIDLVYYGNGRQLEYDLIVAPGADPTRAHLTLEGSDVSLSGDGDLDLTLSDGQRLKLRALVAYQERDGERLKVEAHYELSRHGDTSEIAFQVATYDHERPLIIDPLVYSTFLGGSGFDRGLGIAVNAAGEAFVTGETSSADFPTTPGAFDTTQNGTEDAFVTRVNAAGSALVYSTFLGGSVGTDGGLGIALNAAGEAFVTGHTQGGFPTTPGAFDTTHNGGFNDAFIVKLNAAGSTLVYSTYLGGSGSDIDSGIAVNAAGEAFVTGDTDSSDFPTTAGAFDTTNNGFSDGFIAKLNAAGSALVYSTYLGGSLSDDVSGIAVTTAGEAVVTGVTGSVNFPTTAGAFTTVQQGRDDAFVAKLNASGSALVYSTFLGGVLYDYGVGIAVNAAGEAFVTGSTSSANFPTTAGAFNTIYNGGNDDAFVAKFNPAGALVYSTFLGGSAIDAGLGIAVTAAGEAFVTGATGSANFPATAGAFSTTYNGGLYDSFVAKLNAAGSVLVYSTFLGGSDLDEGCGIAVTDSCEAIVTGETVSANFPTTAGAFDTTHNGNLDAFVVKIATCQCVPPPPDMVAWYPLDELAGATAIIDIAPPPSSAFNNLGMPQPGPVGPSGPTPVAGLVGGALYFNGTYVEVAPQAELDFSTGDFTIDTGVTDFSIDGWVRIVQVGPTLIQPIVDKFRSPSGPGVAFYIRNQHLELAMNASTFVSTGSLSAADPLADTGPWYHVAVTVHGGGRVPGQGGFFINGVQAGTFTPSADSVNNGLPLWIGETRVPGPRGGIAIDELELFNRALPESDIQAIFNAGSAGKCKGCATPPANMVGWWPADGNANDITPSPDNGTLNGGATFAPGEVAQAFSLNGTTAYVSAPDAPKLNFGKGDFSIDAWIKTSSTTGVHAIVDKRVGNNAATFRGYHLFTFNGNLGVELADGTFFNFISTTNVADGAFHHVAATVVRNSATGGHLYVDGVSVFTFNPTGRPGSLTNNAELRIGRNCPNTVLDTFFNGLIDEVELFNRALSTAEVQAIFLAGSRGKCKCTITCPENITKANDPNQCGAVVTYPNPSPSQVCGTAICSPPSGSFFPKGTTTVTCSTTAGPSCTFTVTVNDTQPPTISASGVVVLIGPGTHCAPAYFGATASDNCPGVTKTCSPASGSCFPIGTTTVTCTATDSSGNTATTSFTVTIPNPFDVH